jgi:hypothetical protein
MRRDADCVEKPVQDIEFSRLRTLVTCGDCPRNHTGLKRVFLHVIHRGRAKIRQSHPFNESTTNDLFIV